MVDKWRIVSIGGLPFGWARLSNENQDIVKELCIHESHISKSEGYVSSVVDADPTRVLLEPADPGFYKIEGDTQRVFIKSSVSGLWSSFHVDGHSRLEKWGEVSDRIGSRNFVKI